MRTEDSWSHPTSRPNRAILGDSYPLLFGSGEAEDLRRSLITALRMGEDERADVRAHLAERMKMFSTETVVGRLEKLIVATDRTRH